MTALRGAAIDAYLRKPDPAKPIVLLFGPDSGLVRERADALAQGAVDDAADPFATVRLEGDDLAGDPGRLADEAYTVPLFGGRRAIRVRAGGRSFAPSLEALDQSPPRDCLIIIEAGDLRPDAPLRKTCERGQACVAIACYADTDRDIAKLIDDELRTAGLRIAGDARGVLAAALGGNRQASRNEIRKLALYAHGQSEVTLADVEAIMSDASDLKIDPIVDSAFAGQPAAVEQAFAKALAAGTDAGYLLMMAQRHAASLHRATLAMAKGMSAGDAIGAAFPRLHFSRRDSVERALRGALPARMQAALDQLGTAAFDARRNASLASVIAQRALMAIAANARRRG